jgi:hypothetical protein
MISFEEFFIEDDVPSLEREAWILAHEGDLVGLQHITEIIGSLRSQPVVQRFREIAADLPAVHLPSDSLLLFHPKPALGPDWDELDEFTRDLLNRAEYAREKLGEGSANGRGAGVYIVVALENEVRLRVEDEFHRDQGEPGRRANLFQLWRFLHELGCVSARMANVIDLRNRLVHPPTATRGRPFAAFHFNRLLNQAGLLDDVRKGAFQELSSLKL